MQVALTVFAMVVQSVAPSVQIDAVRANWSAFQRLERAARPLPTSAMVGEVEKILQEGQCRLRGQSWTRFNIDVPFAVLLQPDGTTTRVIVQDIGCAPIESLVGEVALEMARQGDFRSTSPSEARWYADTINFNLE